MLLRLLWLRCLMHIAVHSVKRSMRRVFQLFLIFRTWQCSFAFFVCFFTCFSAILLFLMYPTAHIMLLRRLRWNSNRNSSAATHHTPIHKLLRGWIGFSGPFFCSFLMIYVLLKFFHKRFFSSFICLVTFV